MGIEGTLNMQGEDIVDTSETWNATVHNSVKDYLFV